MPFRLRQKRIKVAVPAPSTIVSSAGAAFSIFDNLSHDAFLTDLSLSDGTPSGQGVWTLTGTPWAKVYFNGTTGPGQSVIGNQATLRIYDLDGLAAGDQGVKTVTVSYVDKIGVAAITLDLTITVTASVVLSPPTSIVSSQGTALQIADNTANNAVITVVSLAGGIPVGTGTWSLIGTPWAKVDFNGSSTTATGLTAQITINDASNLDNTDQGSKTFQVQYTGEQSMSPISLTIGATVYDSTAGTVVRTFLIQNDGVSPVNNARIEVGMHIGPNKWAHSASSKAVCTLSGGIGDIQANLNERSKGWSENNTTRWGALNFVVPTLPTGTTSVQVKRIASAETASPDDAARLALLANARIVLTNVLKKVNRTDAGTQEPAPQGGTYTALWSSGSATVRQRRSGASSSAWEMNVPFNNGTIDHSQLVGRIIATVWSDNTIHLKALVLNSRGDVGFPIVKQSTWGYTATLSLGTLVLGSHTINGHIAATHHYVAETGTQGRGFYVRGGVDLTADDQNSVWVKHDVDDLKATQMVPPYEAGLYTWNTGNPNIGGYDEIVSYQPGGAKAEGSGFWIKGLGAAGSMNRTHLHFVMAHAVDWILNPVNEYKRWKMFVTAMAVGHIPGYMTDPVKFGPVYCLDQAMYTKPTGYSGNDYKRMCYHNAFTPTHYMDQWTTNPNNPSTVDNFVDQKGPPDQCHWSPCTHWIYSFFGSVWLQCAMEDEVVWSVLGINWVYKTWNVGATTYKWHQACLTYNEERGNANSLSQKVAIRAFNAVDGPFYQYMHDIVENTLNASLDVYANAGRQISGNPSPFSTEQKVLKWNDRCDEAMFTAPWMHSWGGLAACCIRHMGGLSKLTWTDTWITNMIAFHTNGKGMCDTYNVSYKTGLTPATLHQVWSDTKSWDGVGAYNDTYNDARYIQWTSGQVAGQTTWWRMSVASLGWAIGNTRCPVKWAKVLGFSGAAAAWTIIQGIDAVSPPGTGAFGSEGWNHLALSNPSYRYDPNFTWVADV